jgi:hypothetical protein
MLPLNVSVILNNRAERDQYWTTYIVLLLIELIVKSYRKAGSTKAPILPALAIKPVLS